MRNNLEKLYDSYPECTEEKQKEYFAKAKHFLNCTRLYGSEKSSATIAIADFLAFSDGVKLIRK